MRKMKLEIEALQVDSFDLDSHSPARRGTVRGHFENLVEGEMVGSSPYICETYWHCTEGTCIGPTYCCAPTWRPTRC
jgi:hypothetical protein